MLSFTQFLEGKNDKPEKKYDFSSVLYLLPDKVSKKVYSWGLENVPDEELFRKPEDPSFGREDEIHCTVIYGLHDKKSFKVRELLADHKPFDIKLGKITSFTTNPDFDVLKIDVTGSDLHRLNSLFRDKLECTINYPEYKPHVTIAYMKKGKAEKHVGSTKFLGLTVKVEEVVFSSKAGVKTSIKLKG